MVSDYDWDDAIIEDTVRCHLCGASWALGGSDADGFLVELPATTIGSVGYQAGGTLCICIECAHAVWEGYTKALRDACICPHGVADGDWCGPCNAEYKRARTAAGLAGAGEEGRTP